MSAPSGLARVARGLALAALLVLPPAAARAREEIVIIRDLPPAAPAPVISAPGAMPPPAPATGLDWSDTRDDAGRSVRLEWRRSPDEGSGRLARYVLERGPAPGGPWTAVDSVAAGDTAALDRTLRRDTDYFYRVTAVGPGGRAPALSVTGPVTARSDWFDSRRVRVLVVTLAFFVCVLAFVLRAGSGEPPPLRRLPGIAAIEDAIARAAARRRPLLFIPGTGDIDDLQTVAGLGVLEDVARRAAAREVELVVPVRYPIPHAVAEEAVRAGLAAAGRPEAYDPASVRFVSPEQFAFVAAITGIVARERPAAVLYMGAFHAESLLLAETGAASGALQVAGTASVHQLPFFVAACDHTLMGEELFAAGAYLTRAPRLVGSVIAADAFKLVIVAVVLIGCALETAGVHWLSALVGRP